MTCVMGGTTAKIKRKDPEQAGASYCGTCLENHPLLPIHFPPANDLTYVHLCMYVDLRVSFCI